MNLNYEPKRRTELYAPEHPGRRACLGGCLGAIVGGVIVPIGLGVYCGLVLNDMGGPLFWPFLAIVGLVGGAIVGS